MIFIYVAYCYFTELTNRESDSADPGTQAHIINIEIHDNHEEATIGAFLIGDLAAMVGVVPSYNDTGQSNICDNPQQAGVRVL